MLQSTARFESGGDRLDVVVVIVVVIPIDAE
jgi:hypothetical protein